MDEPNFSDNDNEYEQENTNETDNDNISDFLEIRSVLLSFLNKHAVPMCEKMTEEKFLNWIEIVGSDDP